MKKVRISNTPITTEAELSTLAGIGGGALSSFTGIVRDDGGVTAIELEHYPSTFFSGQVIAHDLRIMLTHTQVRDTP